MIRFIATVAIAAASGLLVPHGAAAQTPTYGFIQKIALPGDGKWDFLKMDGEGERLFVSHGDRVHVIDLTTYQPIGEITGLSGVHGISFAREHNKGYIANGTTNSLTVFDYKTLKVLKTLPLPGKKPDATQYDSLSQQLFVFNNASGNVTVLDVKTDRVAGLVALGGAPELACTNGRGSLFNNNEETNEVVEIDVRTRQVKHRFPLGPNKGGTGLALDGATNRLFAACRATQTLVVLDASTGKLIQTLPIGAGADGVIFDKHFKVAIVSNGDGTATIVQQEAPDRYRVLQTLRTQPGQKTMVHRAATHRLFLSGADYRPGTKDIVPGTFGVSVYGPLGQ